MGPFNTPWLTFFAWIVALGCIAFSVVWAIWIFKPEDEDE
jgi:hypothetical protein